MSEPKKPTYILESVDSRSGAMCMTDSATRKKYIYIGYNEVAERITIGDRLVMSRDNPQYANDQYRDLPLRREFIEGALEAIEANEKNIDFDNSKKRHLDRFVENAQSELQRMDNPDYYSYGDESKIAAVKRATKSTCAYAGENNGNTISFQNKQTGEMTYVAVRKAGELDEMGKPYAVDTIKISSNAPDRFKNGDDIIDDFKGNRRDFLIQAYEEAQKAKTRGDLVGENGKKFLEVAPSIIDPTARKSGTAPIVPPATVFS